MPTCTKDELRDLYGPVRAYGVTDEATSGVVWLRPSSAQEAWVLAHPQAAEELAGEGQAEIDAPAPWWRGILKGSPQR